MQRWQRPKEYFSDWRGQPLVGGGTLHECGIHYIDILCYLLGKPAVHSAQSFSTKHTESDIEDTVYSLLSYDNFGGTLEVTISAEPRNIECSLSIMTDKGFIKLGGKALDKVEKIKFLDEETQEIVDSTIANMGQALVANSYGVYSGSCPNHPELYRNIENFEVQICFDSLELIDEIYENVDSVLLNGDYK